MESVDGISVRLTAQSQFLIVKAHSHACAIPLSHVIEIMRPLRLETVSGMPRFVLGLSVIRGSPMPVIALEGMLSGKSGETQGRFVALRIETRMLALAVKEVLGVAVIDRAALMDMPTLLHAASTEAVELIGTLDSELLMVLRASRILSEDMWPVPSGGKAAAQ